MSQHNPTQPAGTDSDRAFDAFHSQCRNWRRHLRRTWRGFSDVDAEITASMWDHWTNGVRDEREMFHRVSVDVRRFIRREARQSNIRARIAADPSFAAAGVDEAADVVEHLARTQLLAKVRIPDQVRPWAEHRCGYRDRITEAERVAGFRWAQRKRRVLAHA